MTLVNERFEVNYAAHVDPPVTLVGDFVFHERFSLAIATKSGLVLEALPEVFRTDDNLPRYDNLFSKDPLEPGHIHLPHKFGALVTTYREGLAVGTPEFSADELGDLLLVTHRSNSRDERVTVCLAVSRIPFSLIWKLRSGELQQVGISPNGKLEDAST